MRRSFNAVTRALVSAPGFGSALAFVIALSVGACHDAAVPTGAPQRSCAVTVWYKAASAAAHVEVLGSWNAWSRPGRVLEPGRGDGWRVASFDLPPGPASYAIVDDGVWIADPNVPTSAFHEGKEVAWLEVASCDVPALRVDGATGSADGAAAISATFLASRAGHGIDPDSLVVAGKDGPIAATARVDAASGKVSLSLASLSPGKHTLALSARDTRGTGAESARATVWIEPRAFDLRDAVIYQVMVDRYRDRDGAPLAEPALASGRAGGHVAGVRKAIESGELSSMGFNTVWLSPLYANPSGTFPGADGRPYSSYHGYWPIAARALEPAVANEADVDALVAAAHSHGMRVVFDVVPNHVHEQHPYFAAHKADAWFNHVDGTCVCGSPACDWSTHIQDCWFAPYLPDLDWQNARVADQVSGDVAWWIDRFDGDGVRIDAVPMMPRAANRRIAYELRARFDHPGHRTLLLGENFTGPGGYDLLRFELGPFGLDSEFHFPLLWALRQSIAESSAPMSDIASSLEAGEAAWNGSGAVMGLTIGNHDVSRFASVSAGDGGGDPWTPATQPSDPLVYVKQAMALALTFTLPGIPVVYYGDEVALAGHADPDSRRVMPAESALTSAQRATRDTLTKVGRARACVDALRRGTYRTLASDAEHLVYAREADGGSVAIVVAQRNTVADFSVALPGVVAGAYIDVLGGRTASLRPELTILGAAPFSVQLYLPAGSPCAKPL